MKNRSFFGVILVLLGIGFLLEQFNIISFSNILSTFWPIILIIIGINIIFSKNRGNYKSKEENGNISLEDYIDETVIMGGMETNIRSQEFRGGKITAIVGGIELNLREASLYNNEATIDVDVIMGGVEISVPENWRIEHSGTPILGGFTIDKRIKPEVDAPLLKIKFTAIMGGIEIN